MKTLGTIVASVVLSLVIGSFFFGSVLNVGGPQIDNTNEVFKYGLRAGAAQTQVIDSSGNLVSSYKLGGGTQVTKFSCATATWNPGSVATSTITNATSTDVPLAGAVVGDICQDRKSVV